MEFSKFASSLMLSSLLSCGLQQSIPISPQNEVDESGRLESYKRAYSSKEEIHYAVPSKWINFDFNFGNMKLSARVDEIGNVRIVEYPEVWRGKIKLLRFDGQTSQLAFSKEHCQTIADMSEQGFGIIVRSAFHSLLSVEIPPFLSSDFMYAIIKSAEEAGIKRAAFHLTNPVDVINSTMELKLDDSAISPIIGDMGFIEDQIYIARRGMEVNSFEKHLLVNAGDILCDLAQGKAHIIIKYGINSENENKVITVIYDHMETKLL